MDSAQTWVTPLVGLNVRLAHISEKAYDSTPAEGCVARGTNFGARNFKELVISRKLAGRIFLVALVLPILNCGGGHQADETYYLVSTNTKLPYWQMAAGGLLRAAAQLHVKAEMVGPGHL